jgi:hypothetical protein
MKIFEQLKLGYFVACILSVPVVVIGFLLMSIQISYYNFFILLFTAGTGIFLIFSRLLE